jgi:hypothetical protein
MKLSLKIQRDSVPGKGLHWQILQTGDKMPSVNQTRGQKQNMQSKADVMGEGSSLLENDIAFVPTHASTSGSVWTLQQFHCKFR